MLARRSWLMLLCWTLLGGAVASGVNLLLPVEFEADAQVLVTAPYWNDTTAIADPNYGSKSLAYGDQFTQQRMASYARLATSPLVTGEVSRQIDSALSPEEIAAQIYVRVIPDTVVMEVQVTDGSPTRAAQLADATAHQLIATIKEVERPPFTLVSPVQPVLTEPAKVPDRPVSPRTLLNITCGLAIGLLVGLTYLAARNGRRTAFLRSAAGESDTRALAVLKDAGANSVDLDAHMLRIQLIRRLDDDEDRAIVIASPRSTETATHAAMRLAAALNQSRLPTVVVHAAFEDSPEGGPAGLGDVLRRGADVDDLLLRDEQWGVDWLPPGQAPTSPTRAMTGRKMWLLLSHLTKTYRYVIIVGPGVLESTDTVDLGGVAGVSLLAVPSQDTTADELRESERLMRLSRGHYLGRVVHVVDADEHAGMLV